MQLKKNNKSKIKINTNLNLQQVKKELSYYKIKFSNSQSQKLTTYLTQLTLWNKKINLTGIKNWKEILHNLIADSFFLPDIIKMTELSNDSIILDIGAGAGIPGIPLRIIHSRGKYFLVEPKQKKVTFMQVALSELEIQNTFVYNASLENLYENLRSADLILSRAFLSWNKFIDLIINHSYHPKHLILFSNQPCKSLNIKKYSLLLQKSYLLLNGMQRYLLLFSL